MLGLTSVGILSAGAGQKADQGKKLYHEGRELQRNGDYPGALAKYGAARKIAEELGDKKEVAANLNGLGMVYAHQRSFGQALECFQRALKITKELEDKIGMAVALAGMGTVYRDEGLYDESIESYQGALKIREELGNKSGITTALNNLGIVYRRQGSYAQAVEHFQRALRLKEELGDESGIATALNNLGNVYRRQGSYAQAVEHFQRALKTWEKLDDKRGIADALHNLGMMYMDQGLYAKAIEHYEKVLDMWELRDQTRIALALNNIGMVYGKQGSYVQAVEYFQRALKIREALRDKSGIASVLNNIGNVHWSRGLYGEALECFQRALKISREINAKSTIGNALNSIGNAYLKLQKYPQAMEALQQALALGEEIKEPAITWPARYNLAVVHEKLGDSIQALKHYQSAIEEIEKVRATASSDEGKAGFLQDKIDVYKKACALLLTLHGKVPTKGYDTQALAYAERARARALVDLLAEGLAGLNNRSSPELQEKERTLLRQLGRANQKLQRQGAGPEREAWVAEIRRLEAEHDQLKEDLRRQDPTYANLAYPQPYTLDRIREKVVDDETALLEYLLDEEHSLVYLVGRKELVIERLPSWSRIKEEVTAFFDAVKSPQGDRSATATLQAISQNLYQDLVAPVAARLSRYRNLIIAADGLLHYLPFEALGSAGQSGFRYLIEDHVVSYAPSATVLGELLRRNRNRTQPEALLALGDPDFGQKEGMAPLPVAVSAAVRGLYDTQFNLDRLPFTGEEVQAIAGYFRRREVRVRRAASEDFVKHAALENYRVIHFATHGLLDERDPKASCIVLSLPGEGLEDGFLQVREIYGLKLDADLVVLSACNTGRGRLVNGEGVLGLHRAFFYAGARAVLGSLWSVNDRASADFMNLFYYHLQKGEGKAEALRAAKLKFIKSSTHVHPYYWAAFILQGEPKEALFSETHGIRWLFVCIAVLSLVWVLIGKIRK
jgi:CHAT domain-containing protein/Tfp pilus assembly protein PilF